MKSVAKCGLVAVVLLLLAGSAVGQRSQRMSSGNDIRQRMDQVWARWCAKDAKGASAFYVKDPDAVFFDVAPLKYKGWAEYERGVPAVFDAYQTLNAKVNDDAVVHQQGSWAWATATLTNDSVLKDGKPDKVPLRWTSIWQKRGKDWLIVHEHVSVPAQ